MDETSSSVGLSAGRGTDFRHDLVHDDVVTLHRHGIQNLEGEADCEFESILGGTGEQSVEESAAAAEPVFGLGESKPGEEDKVDRLRQVKIGFASCALRDCGAGDLAHIAVQLQWRDDRLARKRGKKNNTLRFVPLRHFQDALTNFFG